MCATPLYATNVLLAADVIVQVFITDSTAAAGCFDSSFVVLSSCTDTDLASHAGKSLVSLTPYGQAAIAVASLSSISDVWSVDGTTLVLATNIHKQVEISGQTMSVTPGASSDKVFTWDLTASTTPSNQGTTCFYDDSESSDSVGSNDGPAGQKYYLKIFCRTADSQNIMSNTDVRQKI